jgi:catechol 2,3-dioxygenase-like lactoylglutathione lyase family enzyme
MPQRKAIRGIDHFGITVPDLEAATRFFEQAFDAKVLYDNITRADPPFPGDVGSTLVGMAPDATLITMRMIQLGNGPGIELFEMRGPDRRVAPRLSDFGLQHFAVYVDDLAFATERFVAAGGTMFAGPNDTDGHEKGSGHVWCYGRTPWGSLVELICRPGAEEYEQHTKLRRYRPPS